MLLEVRFRGSVCAEEASWREYLLGDLLAELVARLSEAIGIGDGECEFEVEFEDDFVGVSKETDLL